MLRSDFTLTLSAVLPSSGEKENYNMSDLFDSLVLTLFWIGWLLAVGKPLAPPPLMVSTVKLYWRPGNIPPTMRPVRWVCVTNSWSGGVHCRTKLLKSPKEGPDQDSSTDSLVGPCLTDRWAGGLGAERKTNSQQKQETTLSLCLFVSVWRHLHGRPSDETLLVSSPLCVMTSARYSLPGISPENMWLVCSGPNVWALREALKTSYRITLTQKETQSRWVVTELSFYSWCCTMTQRVMVTLRKNIKMRYYE